MSKKSTSVWLRYLTNLWTLIAFFVIAIDFFTHNGHQSAIGPVLAVYIGTLVVYSAEKEFERWAEYYEGRHPGDIYVICWTILLVFLVLASFIIEPDYKIPPEIISTYIGVISIMAFTRKSKSFFKGRKK